MMKANESVDLKHLLNTWRDTGSATLAKVKMGDACDAINSLCSEVMRLQREIKESKKDSTMQAQQYKVMMVEVQNVVTKYARMHAHLG